MPQIYDLFHETIAGRRTFIARNTLNGLGGIIAGWERDIRRWRGRGRPSVPPELVWITTGHFVARYPLTGLEMIWENGDWLLVSPGGSVEGAPAATPKAP